MPFTSSTSAANASVTITLSATGARRHVIYRVDAWTTAGTSQVTIANGGTTIWLSPSAWVTTALTSFAPTYRVEGSTGNAVTITASTAGVGNTVTLNVHHDNV